MTVGVVGGPAAKLKTQSGELDWAVVGLLGLRLGGAFDGKDLKVVVKIGVRVVLWIVRFLRKGFWF